MKEIETALGYTFHDISLLRLALTHPSADRKDNQRLEFLGDAVLQFLMSDYLYRKYPSLREGGLTHHRAQVVCEAALAKVAEGIGIGPKLKMDKGEEGQNGRKNPSILADAMEAVLAAVYLDGGIEEAKKVMLKTWPSEETLEDARLDSKSALQEYLQGKGMPLPTYKIIGESGPNHDRMFTACVYINDAPAKSAEGRTKKAAEQQAALLTLNEMKNGERK